MFNASQNIETFYELSNLDGHQSRYLEWTSASYLTNSIYGRCSNLTTCTEVTLNGKNVTGNGNYIGNINQSTTGNIYGIYDMNGGAGETTMSFVNESIPNSSGFTKLPDSKYYDVFTSNNINSGAYLAITEVNKNTDMAGVFKELMKPDTKVYNNWYNDYAYVGTIDNTMFELGLDYQETTKAGIFASKASPGGYYSWRSFRVILINK